MLAASRLDVTTCHFYVIAFFDHNEQRKLNEK